MASTTMTYRSNPHSSSVVETTPLDGRDGNRSDLKKSYGSDCVWTDGIEDMQEKQEWSRRYRLTETVMGTMTHRRWRCDRQLEPSQHLAAARRRENHRSTRVSWASFLKFSSFRDAARL